MECKVTETVAATTEQAAAQLFLSTNRPAAALACGTRIGVWIHLIPSLRKIASKVALNLVVAVVDQNRVRSSSG